MQEISNNQIIEKLKEKGVNRPCSRCGHNNYSIISKTAFSIQNKPNTFQIGGENIPAVIVACSKCGNLNFHALGSLGLLNGDF